MYKKIFLLSSAFLFLILFFGGVSSVNALRECDTGGTVGWPSGVSISRSVLQGGSASFGMSAPSGAALTYYLNSYNCNCFCWLAFID